VGRKGPPSTFIGIRNTEVEALVGRQRDKKRVFQGVSERGNYETEEDKLSRKG